VIHDLRWWGPRLRMACSFHRFWQFERELVRVLGRPATERPALTFIGSGDFHHVTLALLRRIKRPVNLLVLDKHPDWMRGIPFMHCGTWLYHAARLPMIQRIIHVGGDMDFDNSYRWLAPWRWLRSGKILVIPGIRAFRRGRWHELKVNALRSEGATPAGNGRIASLLEPLVADLQRYPLYVSLDKDVLTDRDAVVNWDSGYLSLDEVESLLETFAVRAAGNLIGIDVVGDWSPVRMRGLMRRFLHWTEHPRLDVAPQQAARCNERTNLKLLQRLGTAMRLADTLGSFRESSALADDTDQ
jgi:arginase family enzyme